MEKIYDREPDGVESYCINQIKIYLTMNMINKGIPYFPTPANFFDEEVMELLEAKFGVLASYIVMRLLCKIYKEGYYISWGKEQNLIFVRKVGGGIKEDMMEKIVDLLLEKGFSIRKPTKNTAYSLRNRFKGCGLKLLHEGKLISPNYLIY